MDFPGPTDDRDFHRDWRRSRAASVELAAADVVRMAANYLLAGCRTAGSLPDSVRRRRLWWSWLSSLQFSAANGRPLGADDARGAREVPTGYALTLRRLWSANQRNQGAGLMVPRWRFAMAGGLLVLTALMSVGIFGVTMFLPQHFLRRNLY